MSLSVQLDLRMVFVDQTASTLTFTSSPHPVVLHGWSFRVDADATVGTRLYRVELRDATGTIWYAYPPSSSVGQIASDVNHSYLSARANQNVSISSGGTVVRQQNFSFPKRGVLLPVGWDLNFLDVNAISSGDRARGYVYVTGLE